MTKHKQSQSQVKHVPGSGWSSAEFIDWRSVEFTKWSKAEFVDWRSVEFIDWSSAGKSSIKNKRQALPKDTGKNDERKNENQ